jgi:hypothetical protein
VTLWVTIANAHRFNTVKYLKNGMDLKVWGFASLFGLTTTGESFAPSIP